MGCGNHTWNARRDLNRIALTIKTSVKNGGKKTGHVVLPA